ncbi:MAG: hypothetical protein ABSG92_08225 [Conexivisphaerales archaeon]
MMHFDHDTARWLIVGLAVGVVRVFSGIQLYHYDFSHLGAASTIWYIAAYYSYVFFTVVVFPVVGGYWGQFDYIVRGHPGETDSGSPRMKKILVCTFIGCLAANIVLQVLLPDAQSPYPEGQPLMFFMTTASSYWGAYGPMATIADFIGTILFTLVDPLEVAAFALVGATMTGLWMKTRHSKPDAPR